MVVSEQSAPEAESIEGPPAPVAGGVREALRAFRIDREKYYAIIIKKPRPTVVDKARAWIWNFELHCIAVHRLGQLSFSIYERHKVLGLGPVVVSLAARYGSRLIHHVDVSHRAQIGPGFHLGHPSTILIGPSVIGANCNVSHNVTIGTGLGGHQGFPTIGNDVWIGPGATLVGAITIGSGATISAGSVVTRDVPPRALVAGNPARVVLADYDNAALLGYSMPVELS